MRSIRRAIVASACAGAVLVLTGPGSTATIDMPRRAVVPATAPNAQKPAVILKRIPFGATRKHQMAAYSKRHYGTWAWRLQDPKVIVEHFTGGNSFTSAWNTFAANSRHLGEMPGTCAHFIIDSNGRIYQLVWLTIRCRHAVGMNWTAFGIEMVGTSDHQILNRPKQIGAAYRLTLWLMQRFHIQLRNVIGHHENLISPYHHELYPSWRCQTHADWNHADMKVFRRHVRAMAILHHVPIGPAPVWVHPNC